VTLDGINVRELATADLRRNIGVVLQEPFLFRGTICDNLVYGRPDAAAEEAVAAARAAQTHDFILRTPLAYDTWLGERGAGLSGGERQRVSIARALLYDPKVLILDEATSSVDAESERAIQQALRHLTHGRTTLAIAHRLSTLRESDRIFVFDQGRLIEQGPHRELMQLDGQYANLVKLQTQVSNTLKFDVLSNGSAEPSFNDILDASPTDEDTEGEIEFTPHWLEPGTAELRRGSFETVEVVLPNGEVHRGISAISCFPATRPDDFISLRISNLDGQEQEIGIVRHLDLWPTECQVLLRAAMAKRYYIRRITGINDIRLEYGYLNFRVQTDQGPGQFTMRWSQSQAQDFGTNGKVLLDLEDNRYLVPEIAELPRRDRELLQRFIYW
jgi:ABC-type multidrug transport system ATPase subunit